MPESEAAKQEADDTAAFTQKMAAKQERVIIEPPTGLAAGCTRQHKVPT